MECDTHTLQQEEIAKSKGMQVELQVLDMRLAVRDDPKKYGYNREILTSKMKQQLPPPKK